LPVKVRAELNDDDALRYVAIAIADSGGGMSDEVKERAFEPFFTTKPSGRGTGLGLSTVYGFVKQSNGAITIDSAPGVGTTLTLYLPRAQDTPAALAFEPGEADTLADGLNVLLVEDDPSVAAVARGFLEAAGSQVTEASSGELALRMLRAGPAFDLLLSDIALGSGMRGTALAEHAQTLVPGLPVLLMSGYSSEMTNDPAAAPLLWELLPKPFSRDQLLQAVARVMSAAR
jgi:CheY-like chemotaxis protein